MDHDVTSRAPVPGCPNDAELAALADGTLPVDERATVAGHVGTCERCLEQVGALVRLQRVPAPVLPAALRTRVATASTSSRRSTPTWRTGVAVAATVCLSLGGWFYAQRSASIPSAVPIDAGDQVRSRIASASTPTVLYPAAGQHVAAGPFEVRWQPTVNAIGYRVRVMRDDGTLLWEAESSLTAIQIPRAAGLPVHAPLYVSVTALMPDGKTARSPSVGFELAPE